MRPPVLGGKIRRGVFATRSPIRPNPIGLSCVRLIKLIFEKSYGPVLYVAGTDMMNKTPIYDIKPYIPFCDSHPEAKGGFSDEHKDDKLNVVMPKFISEKILPEKQPGLIESLSCDPRPAYHHDDRAYIMNYAGMQIKFQVIDGQIKVVEIL